MRQRKTEAISPTLRQRKTEAISPTLRQRKTEAISPTLRQRKTEAISPTERQRKTEAISPTLRQRKTEAISPTERQRKTEAISPTEKQKNKETISPTEKQRKPEAIRPIDRQRKTESHSAQPSRIDSGIVGAQGYVLCMHRKCSGHFMVNQARPHLAPTSLPFLSLSLLVSLEGRWQGSIHTHSRRSLVKGVTDSGDTICLELLNGVLQLSKQVFIRGNVCLANS